MSAESRTSKSIKNSIIALLFYFTNLGLQFFSRKIFLDHLGTEVLGLNTTAMNLLQFLNLAELGIGAAIGYSLYKPLAEKNHCEVNDIVSVQGYLYRKIGLIVLSTSVLLMCFFPWIFAKANVPMWYTFATFFVLLIAALAGYFFNYRQIVFTSDQKDYKLNYATQPIKIAKVILQLFAIEYFSDGYVWWLGLEFVAAVVTVYSIDFFLNREYPWLVTSPQEGKKLLKQYPQIVTKTKQLFFHKIGYFILTQTSPIIIYAYASLTLVAVYGNYMLIIAGVTMLLSSIFNSIGAGVGNLVATGDRNRILCVFRELFSFRFLMVTTVCFGAWILADPFIELWVGKEFLLDKVSLALIILTLYLNTMRNVVDTFINAYGLFEDVWAPAVEALLNLGLSVLLGYYWGLHGILCGVIISLVLIVFIWKPYFLFRYGLKHPLRIYLGLYAKHIGILIVCVWLMYYILGWISPAQIADFSAFIVYGLVLTVIFIVLLASLLYVTESGMKNFINRCIQLTRN